MLAFFRIEASRRVDVLESSRHIEICVNGVPMADSNRTPGAFETGLRPRGTCPSWTRVWTSCVRRPRHPRIERELGRPGSVGLHLLDRSLGSVSNLTGVGGPGLKGGRGHGVLADASVSLVIRSRRDSSTDHSP